MKKYKPSKRRSRISHHKIGFQKISRPLFPYSNLCSLLGFCFILGLLGLLGIICYWSKNQNVHAKMASYIVAQNSQSKSENEPLYAQKWKGLGEKTSYWPKNRKI